MEFLGRAIKATYSTLVFQFKQIQFSILKSKIARLYTRAVYGKSKNGNKEKSRAVARSDNLGGHVILGGENVPPPPG